MSCFDLSAFLIRYADFSPCSPPEQNNHPHGQPYTGPAAQHMNNPQRPGPASAPTPGPTQTSAPAPAPGTTPGTGPRAQENWEGTEEVAPAPTSTPAPAPPKE